jgi:hypothetical protein
MIQSKKHLQVFTLSSFPCAQFSTEEDAANDPWFNINKQLKHLIYHHEKIIDDITNLQKTIELKKVEFEQLELQAKHDIKYLIPFEGMFNEIEGDHQVYRKLKEIELNLNHLIKKLQLESS